MEEPANRPAALKQAEKAVTRHKVRANVVLRNLLEKLTISQKRGMVKAKMMDQRRHLKPKPKRIHLIKRIRLKIHHVPPKGLSKKDYVNKNLKRFLKNEGEATLNNIEIRDEILSNKGPDIGVGGKHAKRYKKIYEEYKTKGDRELAREKIGDLFADGEQTSTGKIPYRDHYSKPFEKHYDEYTKKKKP